MSTRYEYQAEVSHKGLNKYQIVKAATPYELQCKKEAIMARWNEQWSKIVEREQRKKNDEDSENYAREATQKAQELQESLDRIVLSNLSPNELDLNGLKDHSTFQEQQPNPPRTKTIPQAPQRAEAKYNPRPTFMMKLSKKKRAEAEQENTTQFEKDFEKWNNEKHEIEENNRKLTEEYENELHEWQQRLAAFEEKQTSENRKVDYLYEQFKNGDKESVERYFQLLLERIQIPFNYSLSVETEYDAQGKVLIADIQLPSIDDIPKLLRKSSVVPKSIGLPGASSLPTSVIRLYSISLLIACV